MNLLTKLFGSYSKKELKRIEPLKQAVLALDDKYTKMTDEELKGQTAVLKERLSLGSSLDDILPEAFATCREAMWRVLSIKPFPVQIIGGIILHQGRIAEMKTGEGKTFTAALPAYLNALSGKGVHIVTVNDYLAKYQGEMMARVFNYLGLTVGLAIPGMEPDEKKKAYACDITYATNNEIGFDYLRDNMVTYKERKVQRGHNFAIVDEVDSILIDEARTPLIISGQGEQSTELYNVADRFAKTLRPIRVAETNEKEDNDEIYEDYDYIINEKQKTATLTKRGVKKAEQFFSLENLTDPDNITIQHHINQAIKANGIMQRDIDYVVRDGEVIIVDEFTGRLMYGRRYNEGLHQAIEAKEGVKIARESKTLATITFQNFFRLYNKLSGMTGTAMTEESEFSEIYKLDVVEIPTNRPVQRKDLEDAVYMTKKEKFNAVVEAVKEAYAKQQPVLVGTITIETSELISKMLRREGIPHKVLNAKFHELEAEIVAEAGQSGAVTIATNMAGRGTDIKLDDVAREAGGLKIIGTERHESRRIDNQLRGRSGRQGDPGESRFYISLEDDLMRLFGSERLMKVFTSLGVAENEQIEHKMLSNAIQKAQEKIEFNNFGIRKNLLDYDQVNNEQREIIYAERRQVLDGENMRDAIYKMITDIVDSTVDMCFSDDVDSEEWDLDEFNTVLLPIIPIKALTKEDVKGKKKDEIKHEIKEKAVKLYEAKEAEFPEAEQLRELERVVLLKCIDSKWMDHIDDMEILRQGIGLVGYGQRDPVVEYKMSAYEMFNNMISAIQEDTVRMLYHVNVEQKAEREQVAKVTGTNKDDSSAKAPVQRKEDKVYPNDPCPCGSGKKYKQCCGRKLMKA